MEIKITPEKNKITRLAAELTPEMKHRFVESARKICPSFQVTDNIKPVLNDICRYFIGLEGTLSTNKGVYLYGDYGVGKTTTMLSVRRWLSDCFRFNPNGFQFTSLEEILDHYKREGNLDIFTSNYPEYGRFNPRHLLINEFGKDLHDKVYGVDSSRIIDSLMMMRYDIFQQHGKVTHVTSNYPPQSSDGAILDRYIEMFNVVPIGGTSLRK